MYGTSKKTVCPDPVWKPVTGERKPDRDIMVRSLLAACQRRLGRSVVTVVGLRRAVLSLNPTHPRDVWNIENRTADGVDDFDLGLVAFKMTPFPQNARAGLFPNPPTNSMFAVTSLRGQDKCCVFDRSAVNPIIVP